MKKMTTFTKDCTSACKPTMSAVVNGGISSLYNALVRCENCHLKDFETDSTVSFNSTNHQDAAKKTASHFNRDHVNLSTRKVSINETTSSIALPVTASRISTDHKITDIFSSSVAKQKLCDQCFDSKVIEQREDYKIKDYACCFHTCAATEQPSLDACQCTKVVSDSKCKETLLGGEKHHGCKSTEEWADAEYNAEYAALQKGTRLAAESMQCCVFTLLFTGSADTSVDLLQAAQHHRIERLTALVERFIKAPDFLLSGQLLTV